MKTKNEMKHDQSDDYLHDPNNTEKWRESYYFNWVDIENKISGFTTLGILPNEKKREFVFILFYNNKREVYYREPELDDYVKDLDKMLQDKKLSYKMISPLNAWKIDYASRKFDFQITFENRTPLYYFGIDSSASWQQHFESSGKIEGYLKQRNGKIINIKGYGQRDKSWGYRNWHEFDKWFAGHFQFRNWSAGFRKDYLHDKVQLSGYIGKEEENIELKEMNITVKNDNDVFNSPLTSIYEFTDIRNNSYKIKAERINDKSFMRFAREFNDGYTELFEQMVIMVDLNTGELGTGMSEELRTNNK